MVGVKRGEVKKLLVLESLPKPVNFTGGMEPMSYGGTFTLERVLGTVPVEEDGSAYLEVPALRPVFFVALDANNMSIKRMQSFTSVEPGESNGCVGCHERRVQAPASPSSNFAIAAHRSPSRIEPIADQPDIFDFPRDIQPILDRRCVSCHDWRTHDGGVVLTGDRGPIYSQAYFTLFARNQVVDGRNRPISNYPPRALGSSASSLMRKLDASHHGVTVTDKERATIRLWIDTGAPYPGTYSALETGMVGGYKVNALDRSDLNWPSTQAAVKTIESRCASCHKGAMSLPTSVSDDQGLPPWEDMTPNDPRRKYANHLVYNLTRPELSRLLLAPLSKDAGGWESCGSVFKDKSDPGYGALLSAIADAGKRLNEIKRFDMAGFQPHPGWTREMKRYGILPESTRPGDTIDCYKTERAYWQSFVYKPIVRKPIMKSEAPAEKSNVVFSADASVLGAFLNGQL